MLKRKIIVIDEEKCDGCELCISACHEGALAMVEGKAKLVSDIYCDGLGDCLSECPQDAIKVIERDAEAFDEAAVEERQAELAKGAAKQAPSAPAPLPVAQQHGGGGGCPGAAMRQLQPKAPLPARAGNGGQTPSTLRNWPVQLHLVPPQAPYYQGAKILLAADCVPFAHADFHRDMLAGSTLIIGCPKLDDLSAYMEKLTAIFQFNDIREVEVAFMEVPCCHGIVRLAADAINGSGKDIPLTLSKINIDGTLERQQPRVSA